MNHEIKLADRIIGVNYPPLVIAEIGINHEGSIEKAIKMVDDAYAAGCECVKFQCHIIEDEMIPNDIIPANAAESIWDIMSRCALSEEEEIRLKSYVETKGMIYLCTPFSRAAADRLENMNVCAYKIGSGECNNYPLVQHIASFGKPMILSTGMNDLDSISPSVEILRESEVPFAILHCTSMYPTPYQKIRLGVLAILKKHYPDAVIGISDHSIGNYSCFAATALGASILEKHFTSDKTWAGPDIPISIDPYELKDLVQGTSAIYKAMGGTKEILSDEEPTINFACASVVSIRDIIQGCELTNDNIWVKRPGTGEIRAVHFKKLLSKIARTNIPKDTQLKWSDIQ